MLLVHWYIDDYRIFLPGGMSSVTGLERMVERVSAGRLKGSYRYCDVVTDRIGDAQRGSKIVELLRGGLSLASADCRT